MKTGAELQYQLQEHNNDLAEFCENATDMDIEFTVYELLRATKSTWSTSRTTLVVEIRPLTAAKSATDREDEDDVLSELKKGNFPFFISLVGMCSRDVQITNALSMLHARESHHQ